MRTAPHSRSSAATPACEVLSSADGSWPAFLSSTRRCTVSLSSATASKTPPASIAPLSCDLASSVLFVFTGLCLWDDNCCLLGSFVARCNTSERRPRMAAPVTPLTGGKERLRRQPARHCTVADAPATAASPLPPKGTASPGGRRARCAPGCARCLGPAPRLRRLAVSGPRPHQRGRRRGYKW